MWISLGRRTSQIKQCFSYQARTVPEAKPRGIETSIWGQTDGLLNRIASLRVTWMRRTEPNPNPGQRSSDAVGVIRSPLGATTAARRAASTEREAETRGATRAPTRPRCEGLACCRGDIPQPSIPQTSDLRGGSTSPCLLLRYMLEKNMPQRARHASCRRGGRARSHLRGCALAA